jgi:UDP-N-acetylmuramoyl-L-alanyl-D-glutamate--2,6-diaminopimelate ligase
MNSASLHSGSDGTQWRPLKALLGGDFDVREDLEVSDLTLDSRSVQPGAAFLACQGRTQHGLAFATAAARAGARAILWEPAPGVQPPAAIPSVLQVAVPALSAQAGYIADRFFDAPSVGLKVLGFTGTNGKTTCAWLLAQALSQVGMPASYLGTLGVGRTSGPRASAFTTPDAITVQRELANELRAGAKAVAMEVSSQGLDQQRCNGVRFQVAAFTNLSRDHLDYHTDMKSYAAAKAQLFDWPTLQGRVINVDDAFGVELAAPHRASSTLLLTGQRSTLLGQTATRYLQCVSWQAASSGLQLTLKSSFGSATLRSALLGEFNVENLLTVLGAMLALEIPIHDACEALASCVAPAGRMQTLGGKQQPLVVVDYAHTPDGLQKALQAMRLHTSGKLWCVFGCGGDRDAGKRPMMGAIATKFADQVIVTDDNPRTEDAALITAAIEKGATGRVPLQVIHDRAAAIAVAIAGAKAGDTVLVAGKGHENVQITASGQRPFSDLAVAQAALNSVPLTGDGAP